MAVYPALIVLGALLVLLVVLIEQGLVQVTMPPPADGFHVEALIDSWPPAPRPFKEFTLDTTALLRSTRLFEGKVTGSESVVVDGEGVVYLGDQYGYLWRACPNATGLYALEPEPYLYLGTGRALGMQFDPQGRLIVCDVLKGLLRVDVATRQIELLSSQVTSGEKDVGTPFSFVNDLDVGSDGTVYFSHSAAFPPPRNEHGVWDIFHGYMTAVATGHHGGRLLAYNPAERETRVLLSGLWFANGVALSQDESFVLVVETQWLRVWRHWLKGPKAGTSEVAIDRLPASPDGIQQAADGGFWVSLVAPLPPVLPQLRYRALRALIAWMPPNWRPKPDPAGLLLKLGADGSTADKLYTDADGKRVSFISGCNDANGRVLLGNLVGSYITLLETASPS